MSTGFVSQLGSSSTTLKNIREGALAKLPPALDRPGFSGPVALRIPRNPTGDKKTGNHEEIQTHLTTSVP